MHSGKGSLQHPDHSGCEVIIRGSDGSCFSGGKWTDSASSSGPASVSSSKASLTGSRLIRDVLQRRLLFPTDRYLSRTQVPPCLQPHHESHCSLAAVSLKVKPEPKPHRAVIRRPWSVSPTRLGSRVRVLSSPGLGTRWSLCQRCPPMREHYAMLLQQQIVKPSTMLGEKTIRCHGKMVQY